MAIPSVIGTAKGGIAGAGSFVVTPPAGSGGYIAVVSWRGTLSGITPPTGWTALAGYPLQSGPDDYTMVGIWLADAAPGDTWNHVSANGGASVLIVGYSGALTVNAHQGGSATLTSPSITTTEPALVLRALMRQSYNASPTFTYPSGHTLGQDQYHQLADGEYWSEGVAHVEQAAAGTTFPADWAATGSPWSSRVHTIALTTTEGAGTDHTATPADALTLSDSVTAELSSPGEASATDALGLSDSVTVVRTVERTVADTLGLSDAASAAAGAFRFGKAMSTNRRYLVDHLGEPWAMRMTSPWGWVAHYDLAEWTAYFENIAGKGFNATLFEVIATADGGGGINNDGRNYAGQLPFVGGDITTLNDAYWDHIEAIVDAANAVGVTPVLSVIDGWALDPIFVGKSTADCQTYGNAVATRMNGKHVLWHFGGDYAPITNEPWDGATSDLQMRACLAGIRAAGHDEAFTVQLNYNYSFSQQNQFWERELGGNSGDGWSFVYTYFATYAGVEEAYNWTTQANQWPGERNPRPAMFSEGNYWQENVGGGAAASEATTAETLRRQVGWAITFGSPGFGYGDNNWDGTQASYATYLDDVAPIQSNNLADRVLGKQGWHELVPDAALITSGTGTKRTGQFAEDVLENDYATACRNPDGSAAFIYVPTGRSITLDLSRLGANPVAVWYDPTTDTTSPAGAGPTYTSPAAHADGSRDYLLEVSAEPAGASLATTPTDALALSDAVTAALGVTREQADALGITDAVSTALEGVRAAGDTLALTDTVTVELTAQGTTVAADTLALSDAISVTRDSRHAFADDLGLTDAVTVVKTASGSVSDALGMADAITVQFIAEGSVTATIKVTGPFGRGLSIDGPRG